MSILDALQSVLSIMLMIAIGYVLTEKGWMDQETGKLFSKLLINVSLPALMISNLLITFDKRMLDESKIGLAIPVVIIVISYGISMIFSKGLKLPGGRKGIFQAMFAISNTVMIGLPVNMALLGEGSVPYVMLFYAANTTTMWTLGVYGIRKDCGEEGGDVLNLDTIKKILSPPLIAFMVAIAFILLEVRPPEFIMSTGKYLGNMTTPLSMLFMGIILHGINIKSFSLQWDTVLVLLGRFLISPLLAFFVLMLVPVPDLMKKVYIMQAAMPAATQLTIIAQAYKADHQYSMVLLGTTIVFSLAMIPLYGVLINLL